MPPLLQRTPFNVKSTIPVHLSGHGEQSSILKFSFVRVLETLCCLHNVVDVDARSIVQGSPDHARQVKEQCRNQQNNRHPLVIWDHIPKFRFVFQGYVLLEWYIVRIFHPAVVVGICQVIIREMCGHPTIDGFTSICASTHNNGGHHQNGACVAMGKSVDEIVIVPRHL